MKYTCSGSIVLYKTEVSMARKAVMSFIHSAPDSSVLYLIDHSPDDSLKAALLPLPGQRIKYRHHPENRGYGAGHNIAIRQIINDSPAHYIINPDITFEKKVIPELNHILETHPRVGMLMPQIRDEKGDIQYLAKLLPRPVDVFAKRFLPAAWTKKMMDRFQLKFTSYTEIMNVPYLSGSFMAVRTSVLRELGLFDERFFMYPEDIDLTRRIHETYETWYYPYVHVEHLHEASSYKSIKMLKVHIENMIRYFNKWGWFRDKKRKQYNQNVLRRLSDI